MRTTTTRIAGAGFVAAAALALSVGPAFAADGFVSANLKPVAGNGVNGSGTAMVEVKGNQITVTMAANGLLADSPHAAHIHFAAAARHECPALSDDKNGDGHLNTTEGGPAYGDIVVSLTKPSAAKAGPTLRARAAAATKLAPAIRVVVVRICFLLDEEMNRPFLLCFRRGSSSTVSAQGFATAA